MRRRSLLVSLALASLVAGCASFPQRLERTTVRSTALRDTYAEYAVYVPPDFTQDERLPLVLFLHGGGDGPDCFDRHGVSERLDRGMRDGSIPRAVIAIPQGDLGFWANWYDGSRSYEDWAVDEVLPRVARRHHTQACPEGCHLMGVSMGAEGAIRIAMHRPGAFASVTSISGPSMDTERRISFTNDRLVSTFVPTLHVFGPTEPRSRVERDDPFVQWRTPDALGRTRLMIAWASQDRDIVREGGEALHAHLDQHGVQHVAHVFEGEHGWDAWAPVIEEALRVQLGAGQLQQAQITPRQ
ncbi:alpha/beta hydrolase [Sandaracinus amylolyticus]|uniref:alpha/beta hydrolase n=1 Tax=Sandaracinus amylolyticus TaxID=927083 RepID=UPI001F46B99B|nr:alpha/beta hydrolase-fold protein [Sandaracinus amylolyticus]UJR81261.1 Carbohydrate esterase [Sandaracinus amylolyticus]